MAQEIEKEIEQLAERMTKSVADGKQALFDTILTLGPDGLKKALPSLSPEQQELVKQALEEMKKAANPPVETDDAKKLSPEHTKTPAKKMETESLSGSDKEDEKLMEDKNRDIDHQGGPKDKPEGYEGQVIKAKEPVHSGMTIGHTKAGKPIYENAGHESHKEFYHEDHNDAAEAHQRLADKHYNDAKNSPYASVAGLQSLGGKKKKFKEAKEQHEKDSLEHDIHRESSAHHRRMADAKSGAQSGDLTPDDHKAQADRHLDRVNKLMEIRKCGGYGSMMKDMGGEGAGGYGLSLSMDKGYEGFKAVEESAKESGAKDPKAVAAAVGMKKYGKQKMEEMAHEGKKAPEMSKADELKKEYENFMTKAEKEALEKKQGVPEGVDPEKWERGVKEVKKKPGIDNPYAVVNAAMTKGDPMGDEKMKPNDVEGKLSEQEKLEKKKMRKARKMAKALQKIVKMAKSLGLTQAEVKKAIEDANGNLKIVKSEMKTRILKEEDQVKVKPQDESEISAPKPDESQGELKISSPANADEALKELPAMKKSVRYSPKSSIAAGTLGRNTHWDVDAFIEKSEQEKKDIIAKGGYFGEQAVEELKKAQDPNKKLDINDMLEKGFDKYSTEEITRLEGIKNHKADQGAVRKSSYDVEIARSMGMSKEEYEQIFGSNE